MFNTDILTLQKKGFEAVSGQMCMTDILLIQPPIRDFYLTAKRTIPYGLSSIASVLIQNGFSVDLFDGLATGKSRILEFPEEMEYLKRFYGKPDLSPFSLFHHFRHFGYSFETIGKMARDSGAYLVGISSLFTAYSETAIKTAETVKAFHPDCRIVLGGHHPTAMPCETMETGAVDFLIRGEGEVSMPALAEAIRKKKELNDIPGIVFRRRDGSLHVSPPAVMADLDRYPLPSMRFVKQSFYQRKKSGSSVIVTSRGCPMKCSYCSVGASGLPYRRRNVDSVVNEIETAVVQHHVRFIDFEDENLCLEKKWFLHLLSEIEKRLGNHRVELRAMNGIFPPSLDEEMIYKMKASGFKTLNLSLGSTSSAQLERFSRPDVRDSLEQAVSVAERIGLDSVCYIIAGAPGQIPSETVLDLLYLAKKQTIAGVSIFYPSPGSPDFEKCRKIGILPEKFSLMRSSAFPISHSTNRVEAATLLRLGRILNFIKSIKKSGAALPSPLPYHGKAFLDADQRKENGLLLLAWFFNDGRIRGVKPTGEVFDHLVSETLTEQFISGISEIFPF